MDFESQINLLNFINLQNNQKMLEHFENGLVSRSEMKNVIGGARYKFQAGNLLSNAFAASSESSLFLLVFLVTLKTSKSQVNSLKK